MATLKGQLHERDDKYRDLEDAMTNTLRHYEDETKERERIEKEKNMAEQGKTECSLKADQLQIQVTTLKSELDSAARRTAQEKMNDFEDHERAVTELKQGAGAALQS